jgi:hypothetical protein
MTDAVRFERVIAGDADDDDPARTPTAELRAEHARASRTRSTASSNASAAASVSFGVVRRYVPHGELPSGRHRPVAVYAA